MYAISSILNTTWNYYDAHFTDDETKAQRNQVASPRAAFFTLFRSLLKCNLRGASLKLPPYWVSNCPFLFFYVVFTITLFIFCLYLPLDYDLCEGALLAVLFTVYYPNEQNTAWFIIRSSTSFC